jgi:autotransporter-associated beta strand protein
VNGGVEPVSVLLDDTRAGEHLFGKLSDGENGQLGLVKRGSGERVIETEDAAYTGPTEVHGGTLTVARKRASVTARYIRITPLAMSGSDGTYPWAMHEFQLLDTNGNAVAWPSGATATKPSNTQSHADAKLIDGDITTRFLMGKYNDGTPGYAPATIDAKTPVTFSSYKWWSSHRHEYDVTRRLPTSWV